MCDGLQSAAHLAPEAQRQIVGQVNPLDRIEEVGLV
jgi:hypothetical protein